MGSGTWSTDVYGAAAHYRAAAGTSAFDYSDSVTTSSPRHTWTAHPRSTRRAWPPARAATPTNTPPRSPSPSSST